MEWNVAAIQMNSGADLQHNLQQVQLLISQAAANGADYALLPEYFYLMGKQDADRLTLAEPFGGGPIQQYLSQQARLHGLWLQAGSVPLVGPDADHIFNSSLIFNPDGDCVSRYDKIHLFAINDAHGDYRESDTLAAGDTVVTTDTPFGPLRNAICYDLRFPELFRQTPAFDLISLPAAFTHATGEAHWLPLLRARAIECQAYVIASGQTGWHANGKRTFGHSLIIDPWGEVLDLVADDHPGIAQARISKQILSDVRQRIPALQHRSLNSAACSA